MLTEAVSIARSIAMKSGQRIDGNQELVGQGLSKPQLEAGLRTPPRDRVFCRIRVLVLLTVAPLAAYHLTKRGALKHVIGQLDTAICAAFRARIFEECRGRAGAPAKQ